MRKKKLYEVNRFNKPLFQFENVFDGLTMGSNQMYNWNSSIDRGRAIADASRLSYYNQQKQNGSVGQQGGSSGGNNGLAWASAAAGSAEGIGAARNREYSSAANNGFSTVDSTLAGGRRSEVGMAGVNTGASLMNAGLQSNNKGLIIAGGLAGAIGTGVNLLTGVKEDTEKLNAVDQNINQNRNFRSDAKYFDDVQLPVAALTDTDIYDTAPFASSKWREKEKKLKEQMLAAADWADRSVGNNIYNIKDAQLNDALANYNAYGGPMVFNTGALGLMQQDKYFDTINKRSDALAGKGGMQTAFTGGAKTFDEGGLKTSFLDDFGKDPIAAAVRYNQGLEALAAQEEERKMAAAREAEYANMQNRLLSLETQNQGLQALLDAQSVPTPSVTDVTTESVEAAPEPSYAPSAAGYNSNWDYIEDQLRRSGKFNDIQIEGIKYNLQRESGIDPDAVGDGGQALGLGQWHGSRQPKDRSLEGQTRHLIDTLSNYDGTQHWIGRGNYEGFLNARTPEEAHYYITKGYERPANYILAKVKRDSDKSLRNINAFGGELGTNSTDFTNGLLYVDEGGTHEENPLDGVPMGLDPQGVPNLVEEGETVYDNYVFSNRLTVPNFMLKDLGLPNSKKKITFADASKKLAKESEKRPNDPLSQAGLDAGLSRLAEIQETERMKKQAEEYMGLGNKAAYGGKLGRKYEGKGETPQYLRKPDPKWWEQDITGMVHPIYDTPWSTGAGGSIDISYPVYEPKPLQKKTPTEAKKPTANKTTKSTGKQRIVRRGDNSSNNEFGYENNNAVTQETAGMTDDEFRTEYPMIARPADNAASNTVDWTNGSVWEGLNIPSQQDKKEDVVTDPHKPKTYDTWMRYAPAVGSGLMALTDALGITNKPDYTMADKLEASAERAGYAPNISYDPIGDYLRYVPMDIWYEQNRMDANARATDRALLNTSSPSKAAGLLANGYNSQIANGNLYRQALEYNDAKRERVADFNRKTNMFNSQMGLEADMANARYQQAASQMGLSGLAQAAALRDQIDARTGAAKSANLTNFLTSLGNIGRENFAMNQINWDRSRRYKGRLNGTSGYAAKNGGKLNRK